MKFPRTPYKTLILALAAVGSAVPAFADDTADVQTASAPATQQAESPADQSPSGQTAPADGATSLESVEVKARRLYASGYQPISADVIGGGNTPLLEVPRSVNIVTPAVLEDRRPGSLDEALLTVSGIRQANTMAGTLEAVVKRGFGDNRDNSVLRNGMQMTQTHVFNPPPSAWKF